MLSGMPYRFGNVSRTFEGIRRVRSLILSLAEEAEEDIWMALRKNRPNPFYNQTAEGLVLELYYGLPNTLWTPWGKYRIGGSGSGNWEPTVESALPRLGAICLRGERYSSSEGVIGPYYTLSRVDDFDLPEAALKSHGDYTGYEETNKRWAEACQRFGRVDDDRTEVVSRTGAY